MDGMLVRRTGQVNALDHEGLTVLLDGLVARPASLLGDAFQKLTRKVVSTRALNYLSAAGMLLFLGFFLIMANQDIQRFVFGNW